MSAATEQNNGDVAVDKVAAKGTAALKEYLDTKKGSFDSKAEAEETTAAAADNGTASKGAEDEDSADGLPGKEVKGTKRPAEAKTAESKKAKKDKNADADSDEEEVLEEIVDSELESEEEYDIPYEEDVEGEDDDDDENDDGSGSDDQA